MGSFSIFHWLLVLAVILILFGAGRLPSVMGDLAKGIKAFRSGLKDEGEKPGEPAAPAPPAAVAPPLQAAPHAQPAPAVHPADLQPHAPPTSHLTPSG